MTAAALLVAVLGNLCLVTKATSDEVERVESALAPVAEETAPDKAEAEKNNPQETAAEEAAPQETVDHQTESDQTGGGQEKETTKEQSLNTPVAEEEPGDEKTQDDIFCSLIFSLATDDVVREISQLDDESKAKIEDIWVDNAYSFQSADEMFEHYGIVGLSKNASNLLFVANTIGSFRYVCENYTGDPVYLNQLIRVMENCAYSLCGANDLSATGEAVSDVYMDTYLGICAAEEMEIQACGESELLDLYCRYGEEQGKLDCEEFFGMMWRIQSEGNG